MLKPTLVIRRHCRHGESHPHHHLSNTGESLWCTDGDSNSLTREDATTKLFDVLVDEVPRVPKDDAMVKTRQLVDALFAEIR